MALRLADGVPNDQWEDVKTYARNDPRTLKRHMEALLLAAKDEVRTAKTSHIRDGIAVQRAEGVLEGIEAAYAAVTSFLKPV